MKTLLVGLLFVFSLSAYAVDVTISMTAPQVVRYAAALGKARNLVDGSNQPRNATVAEMKQYIIDSVRGVVMEQERQAAVKTAVDAVPAPAAFDPL